MGCGSSKSASVAMRLDDGPSSQGGGDGSSSARSVRSVADVHPSTTDLGGLRVRTPEVKRGGGVGGGGRGGMGFLAVRSSRDISLGDTDLAAALQTRQRHRGIVSENTSQLMTGAPTLKRTSMPKDPHVLAFLVEALRGNMFFGALGEAELASIAGAMEALTVPSGTTVVKAGEVGDCFYVVESGRMEMLHPPTQATGTGTGATGATTSRREEFGEGTSCKVFGELSVLFHTPRPATVRALTNAKVWRVDRGTYRALAAAGQEEASRSIKASLAKGILESLEEEQLTRVAEAAQRVRYAPGECIIAKGEPGEVFYIIEGGSVVCKDQPGEQRDNLLSAGDYFGERALLKRGEARPCNVYAGEAGAALIALHRVDFEASLGHLRDLLEHNAGMRLLLCVPPLADASEEDKVALFRRLRLLAYKPGAVLCGEGTSLTQLFIIKEGEVEVGVAAAAAASASPPIPNPSLRRKLAHSSRSVPPPSSSSSSNSPSGGGVEGWSAAAGAGAGASAASAAGDGGGDGGGSSASAATTPPPPPPLLSAPGIAVVGILGAGQWFGEGEVVEHASSPYTYTAATHVQCFVLDSEAYKLYVAPIMDKLNAPPDSRAGTAGSGSVGGAGAGAMIVGGGGGRGGGGGGRGGAGEALLSNNATSSSSAAFSSTPVKPPHRERLGIPFKELEQRTTLGTGTFGRVRIVYHRKTNKVYALKMLQKSQIVEYKQQANIMNEKELLWRLDHPFIIRLYDTYKDRDRLYMLLEVVQGGELFARLQNSPTLGRITPSEARFYASCVLDALDYLHAQHIVYRDLKPENLLIDAGGFLKMVDFGFAKVVKDRTYTVCGTPEYLSPELVLGKAHGAGVDYWALGILLFEQVSGYSPFADAAAADQMVICRQILKSEPVFPPHVKDRDLKDLVGRLLTKDASKRLGCTHGGAGEVKAHPFFRHVDWAALRAKTVPVPWTPLLRTPLDTSNFDPYDETDDAQAYQDDGTGWDASFTDL